MLEPLFKVRGAGSTPGREVLGGVTTFLTMAYILAVNPVFLVAAGMPLGGAIAATAVAAALATLLMALLANYPIALAPGMGMNAFFAYGICIGAKVPWPTALGLVLWSGVAFLALTLTGVRRGLGAARPPADPLPGAAAGGAGADAARLRHRPCRGAAAGVPAARAGHPVLRALRHPRHADGTGAPGRAAARRRAAAHRAGARRRRAGHGRRGALRHVAGDLLHRERRGDRGRGAHRPRQPDHRPPAAGLAAVRAAGRTRRPGDRGRRQPGDRSSAHRGGHHHGPRGARDRLVGSHRGRAGLLHRHPDAA